MAVQQVWDAPITADFKNYLGLPTMVGRSKTLAFRGVWERVAKHIQGWGERLLSKAGREILLKAVVQSLPTYTMSCFKLTKSICDDLTALFAKFWWGQRRQGQKIHWMKWGPMCRDKVVRGLGFRDLENFNLVLLAKQG